MWSIEGLPGPTRTATTCPSSHLPCHLQSSRSSLSHDDRRLHHWPRGVSRLAPVALHRCSAEPPCLTATPVSMVHVLCAPGDQRNDHALSHAAAARTCRSTDVPVFFPHNPLYLRLTLGCKQHNRTSVSK